MPSLPLAGYILIYLLSFVAIWMGGGLVVNSVAKVAERLRLPEFTVSFFLLGGLTSLPELSIGLTAIANGEPEIFVGNLIGGVIIMFLMVIPLLGVVNNGVKAPAQLDRRLLLLLLVVCVTPAILTGDRQIDKWEGVLCILLYASLLFFFWREQNILEKIVSRFRRKRSQHGFAELAKIMLGIVLLFVSSGQIVDSTLYFSELLGIAPFFVSLIIVSFGTNLPEISIIFRSLLQKKAENVALAGYLGSASVNTLFFGVFSLLYPTMIMIPSQFYHRFLFIFVGLTAFYFFLRSGKRLSRTEGAILLAIYVAFVVIELRLAG